MVNCSAYGCRSRSEPGISFHSFPKDLAKRKMWIKNMEVENWEPTANSRLCSKHFEDCFIYKTDTHFRPRLLSEAIPTFFNELPKYLQPKLLRKRALATIRPEAGSSTSTEQPDPDTPRKKN